MRVVVTRIGPDGAMRRQMVDTAASSDAGPWEDLITRALAALPLYRPVPGALQSASYLRGMPVPDPPGGDHQVSGS
jgi:hypothetical protein